MLDAGAFIALDDREDAHHEAATACLNAIALERRSVVTCSTAVVEAHRRLLHKVGAPRARLFLERIFSSEVRIVHPGPVQLANALALVHRYADADLTLADAIVMAISEEEGILSVFSFDGHFSMAGFVTVPPLQQI